MTDNRAHSIRKSLAGVPPEIVEDALAAAAVPLTGDTDEDLYAIVAAVKTAILARVAAIAAQTEEWDAQSENLKRRLEFLRSEHSDTIH